MKNWFKDLRNGNVVLSIPVGIRKRPHDSYWKWISIELHIYRHETIRWPTLIARCDHCGGPVLQRKDRSEFCKDCLTEFGKGELRERKQFVYTWRGTVKT